MSDASLEQLAEILRRATCPACQVTGQMTVAERYAVKTGGSLSGSRVKFSVVKVVMVTCGACGASGRVAGVSAHGEDDE
jgi:RNase P subunit RPR2